MEIVILRHFRRKLIYSIEYIERSNILKVQFIYQNSAYKGKKNMIEACLLLDMNDNKSLLIGMDIVLCAMNKHMYMLLTEPGMMDLKSQEKRLNIQNRRDEVIEFEKLLQWNNARNEIKGVRVVTRACYPYPVQIKKKEYEELEEVYKKLSKKLG